MTIEYTHDFKLKVGAMDIEGEIVFNSGNEPSFNTNSTMEASLKGLDVFNNLIKSIATVHNRCGGIDKIEFNIKE